MKVDDDDILFKFGGTKLDWEEDAKKLHGGRAISTTIGEFDFYCVSMQLCISYNLITIS